MNLIVQKFGGTSLASVEHIQNVAKKVLASKKTGKDVVVVVSAMAKETDRLLDLTSKISTDLISPEMDLVASTGETIMCALLSMALHTLGQPARSFLGHEIPILTDNSVSQAQVLSLNPSRTSVAELLWISHKKPTNIMKSTSWPEPPGARLAFAGLHTLLDVALEHAQKQGDKQFLLWLDKGVYESCSYTFAELDVRAKALAVRLLEATAGKRASGQQGAALIATKPGLEFVVAFFACIYAGVAAVPVLPLKPDEPASRLFIILQDSGASAILTDRPTLRTLQNKTEITDLVPLLSIEDTEDHLAHRWQYPNVDADTVAFIQYTSGSTGFPKGVVITHRNLISNQLMIAAAMHHDSETVFVSWCPVYHDMGLIGNLIQPFCLGVRCVIMSPLAFIANPFNWLQAISKYRGTTSGGPNFAYELCLSRIDERQIEKLDLSCWKVAFNGAEPIRSDTLRRFAETFASAGFNEKAIYPCYGMAEGTLLVTGKRFPEMYSTVVVDKDQLEKHQAQIIADPERHDGKQVELVSSGYSMIDCEVLIVDPRQRTPLDEREIGEIWVSAPSVSAEYKNQPTLSNDRLNARIAGQIDQKAYLRSGDLGFMHEGELYVTGRSKELIIVAGKNHYPQDIEATVKLALMKEYQVDPTFTCAAFAVEVDEVERMSLVLYVPGRTAARLPIEMTRKLIRTAVTRHHGLAPHDVRIVSCRLPVTSSGKLKRIKCKEMLVNGAFDAYTLTDTPDGDLSSQLLPAEEEAISG